MDMHADQLHVDAATVGRLVAEQFPRWAGAPVTEVSPSGTVNAMFRLGPDVAARFALDPSSTLQQLEKEAAAAREFAAASPFPTPEPLGIGEPGHGYPLHWAVQTWLPGEVATPAGEAHSAGLAADIARLILALRSIATAGRTFSGGGRGGSLRAQDDWIEVCLRESEGLLDVARLRTLWTRLRRLPPLGSEVMSHQDLIPANLLVADGRLVGVLDAGGFGPADPALDLAVAWHLFDPERRDLLRATIGASALEWERGMAWAFVQAMGLVWYYRQSLPAFSEFGRSTLGRILGDRP